jgi:uncharacterized delta-60 repeat protein
MLEKLEPRTLFNGEADHAWGLDGVVYNGSRDAATDAGGRLIFLEYGLAYAQYDSGGQAAGSGNLSPSPSTLESRIAFQPDGRFFVAGALGVRQYAANGSFVRQFTGAGGHFANVASDEGRFFDIAVMPNGDVLVSGVVGQNLTDAQNAQIDFSGVERYTANGVFQYAISDTGRDRIVALPDGRFLVGDLTGVNRYLANGQLDPTFNNHAPLQYGPTAGDVFTAMNSLGVDAFGRIYGYSFASNRYLVVRLMPDGQIDTTYGDNGFANSGFGLPLGGDGEFFDDGLSGDGRMVIAPDGSAYIAGQIRFAGDYAVALRRLTPQGAMDLTFGSSGDGKARPDNGGIFYGTPRDVEMFPDGDIFVAAVGGHNVRFNITPPASAQVELIGGKLTVLGTSASDVITIDSKTAGKVTVTANGVTQSFTSSAVATIEILAGGGNDLVDSTSLAARMTGDVDFPVTIDGGAGDDVLLGHQGRDRITGASGNDRIFGAGGDDWLSGNAQTDKANGGDGNDSIFGNGGSDRLEGGAGNDTIFGGDQPDGIGGDDGNDSLSGEGGHDRINGGAGADFMSGGGGNDTFFARDNNVDAIVGGIAGHDRAQVDMDDSVVAVEELLA